MKRKKNWKKRIAALLAIALLAGGCAWKYAGSHAPQQDETLVREREYTASIGDITVGINVAGKLSGETTQLYGTDGIDIDRWLVDAGDRVTTGEKLAEYSLKSLDRALTDAFKEYSDAQTALDEARTAQKDGLSALVSRLSREKKLSSGTYSAYTKFLKNLKTRLENEKSDTKRALRESPGDVELNARLEAAEQKLENVQLLLEDAADAREGQKDAEGDALAQTDADLLETELLDERVNAAERNLQICRDRVLALQSLTDDPAIRAPQDGVVVSTDVDAGGEVKAGQAVLTLSTGEGWDFSFNAEQSDISGITEGQAVELIANAYPTDTLYGTVSRIKYIANDEGKYAVTVRLEGTELELMDGMDAYGVVILAKKDDVLTLSNKAIYQRDGAQYVKVRGADGELVERRILTGFSDGKVSAVQEGLEPGDTAVVVDVL